MPFLLSCSTTTSKTRDSKDSVILNYENIPLERKEIDPNPVKIYTETINNPETIDEFKVAIYETKETFHYLIKFSYKNLEEEDTLKVPNFGIRPSFEIKKGETRPSCIIGFYDEKKQFRESKLIYFDNDELKVRVLKRYAVSTYQSEAH
jgi:hypothetical protein